MRRRAPHALCKCATEVLHGSRCQRQARQGGRLGGPAAPGVHVLPHPGEHHLRRLRALRGLLRRREAVHDLRGHRPDQRTLHPPGAGAGGPKPAAAAPAAGAAGTRAPPRLAAAAPRRPHRRRQTARRRASTRHAAPVGDGGAPRAYPLQWPGSQLCSSGPLASYSCILTQSAHVCAYSFRRTHLRVLSMRDIGECRGPVYGGFSL
mmetsp:Transcript_67530/g.175845  ORF Transcript_67530/g.175845 Transcript_67530/m.175845 type:complete len:206 (+) Transcript_67530:1559-2176(+)